MYLELVREDSVICECGQSVRRQGPTSTVDSRTGDVTGGYSHQHGCGVWNSPVTAAVRVDFDGSEDWETEVESATAAALANLGRDYEKWQSEQLEKDRSAGQRDLEAAIHGDADDEFGDGYSRPGVFRDEDGRLGVWGYVPGHADDTWTIYEDDLSKPQ